jgi:hypothetical protein
MQSKPEICDKQKVVPKIFPSSSGVLTKAWTNTESSPSFIIGETKVTSEAA